MNERFEVIPLTGQWVNEVERVEQLCFSDPWSRNGLLSDLTSSTSFWYGAVERRSGRLGAVRNAHRLHSGGGAG